MIPSAGLPGLSPAKFTRDAAVPPLRAAASAEPPRRSNNGRDGVGNVSRTVHGAEPGDGGNGTHAVNNAELAGDLNPITGERVADGAENVSGELLEGTSAD
jgi:hypothetical protein